MEVKETSPAAFRDRRPSNRGEFTGYTCDPSLNGLQVAQLIVNVVRLDMASFKLAVIWDVWPVRAHLVMSAVSL
jgi:hypothetical protein